MPHAANPTCPIRLHFDRALRALRTSPGPQAFPPIVNTQWKNFAEAIDKAITTCHDAGYDLKDHFADASKMVDRGIVPEKLPPAEDVKKVERRLASEQKKLPGQTERLEGPSNED